MLVNGEEFPLDGPVSIKAFLERQGYQVDRVAVQKNGEIISRFVYEQEMLTQDDRLEIVSFVGGG